MIHSNTRTMVWTVSVVGVEDREGKVSVWACGQRDFLEAGLKSGSAERIHVLPYVFISDKWVLIGFSSVNEVWVKYLE